MLDNYDRGEVTPPPPMSGYGGSPGLLALHSSLYATPTSRTYDIDSGIDGNDSSMPIDTQIISVRVLANFRPVRDPYVLQIQAFRRTRWIGST